MTSFYHLNDPIMCKVSVVGPCTESCAIYASVTPDSLKLATNLLIQTPLGFCWRSRQSEEPKTNEKLSLVLESTHELKIVNGNANANAGPLVLYVVEGSHDDNGMLGDSLMYIRRLRMETNKDKTPHIQQEQSTSDRNGATKSTDLQFTDW
ncbi:hypothetical protein PRIPAC_78136 [Pristionchus pacificus]|uniref:Uncharacterized protein n=1 Tax=Pristionchus pacificus TaxID=54126 RepID=A0A2A6CM07_PRIPA|nr:hypothetical protein PRIPAC_78136 [Pristionchus pacificus]|eukprot:PDM79128.1 hypothetical protein PRIPAC_31707 [Pristionchus pacificus]